MKRHLLLLTIVLGLCAGSILPAHAQLGGPGSPNGLNAAMMKIFGKNTAFTAKAEVKISGTQEMTMPMEMAVLDGKMRTSMDITAMKGAQFPPQAAAQMKQMGMDLIVTITTPAQKSVLMIYPNLKSYSEMPVPAQGAGSDKEPKIEKTEIGKDTVDGRATVKNKVVITDGEGKATEMTVWNAPDLKDFPVKMEIVERGNQVTIVYKDIKTGKPDAKLFEAPADYKKYGSPQEMMMEVMQKGQAPK